LTSLGGGAIGVSSDSGEAQEPYFQVTIGIDDPDPLVLRQGMTVLAQVSHGGGPSLGRHLYRRGLRFIHRLWAGQ
jgi:hypothetical protein